MFTDPAQTRGGDYSQHVYQGLEILGAVLEFCLLLHLITGGHPGIFFHYYHGDSLSLSLGLESLFPGPYVFFLD